MPSNHIKTSLLVILTASAMLTAIAHAADASPPDSGSTAQGPSLPPLVAPARSTPVSSSQTSATPNNGNVPNENAPGFTGWARPAWLSELSFGVKESYDDNILRVSGNGLPTESSWVDVLSFRLGLNLASLLSLDPAEFQTFSVVYEADHADYSDASSEDFTAHHLNALLKAKVGDFSYGIDNAFLYNDGDRLAPTYALNQVGGTAANQNDKYRNTFSHAAPRERRNQIQDRYAVFGQYDTPYLFVRAASALNYFDMRTYQFNTSLSPYKGYQDYVDRYDVNAGGDVGFKVSQDWALTVGYRDGYQYQQQFSEAINTDQHYSSNHYQRLLFGLEGKLSWLTVKLAAGPDFRDFNPDAPINDLHTTRFYGEANLVATLAPDQTLTLNYRDVIFVSSTGLVPYEDYVYGLVYHWGVTKQLGLDLTARLFEQNYTIGNDVAGSAPSLRDDFDYEGIVGITYALTPHLIASLSYSYDKGLNGLTSLPAKYFPSYRDFEQGVFGAGLQYRF